MKTRIVIAVILLMGFLPAADAQVLELVKIVTEKVIKAMDLRVQEMQNSVLVLQNMQRQAENNLSRQKLAEIGAIEENAKDLFRDYYASLQQIKPSVAVSVQVRMIRERGSDVTALYNKLTATVKRDNNLQEKEKRECMAAGDAILIECNTTMQKLNEVLTSARLTATDAERLRMIGLAANQQELAYRRLAVLLNNCHILSAGRAKSVQETQRLKALYGL